MPPPRAGSLWWPGEADGDTDTRPLYYAYNGQVDVPCRTALLPDGTFVFPAEPRLGQADQRRYVGHHGGWVTAVPRGGTGK